MNRGNSGAAGLKIGLLVLVFFGPLALAWVLYYALPGGLEERTHQGELLQPVRPLPSLTLTDADGQPVDESVFRELWTLLVVAPEGCAETCRVRLADTRQIRALLHRRSTRVQRLLVSGVPEDAALREDEHPDLRVLYGGDELTAFFAEAGAAAVGPGTMYLIDPLGNWVLYYPAGMAPDALYDDLKHLLKLSQIG